MGESELWCSVLEAQGIFRNFCGEGGGGDFLLNGGGRFFFWTTKLGSFVFMCGGKDVGTWRSKLVGVLGWGSFGGSFRGRREEKGGRIRSGGVVCYKS